MLELHVMSSDIKPKHQVLKEFTAALRSRNPMNVLETSPLEYEVEALSILSRFTETGLHIPTSDEALVAQLATNIVKQSLEFWFDDLGDVDPEPIARELIAIYRASFVSPENPVVEKRRKQVKTVSIGE